MKCPFCSSLETKVLDSRMNQQADIIRRRRGCGHCEGRFTTYERVEEVMPVVIKKDGRRETYSREKMNDGITKACQKREVTTLQIESTVSKIEKKIQSFGLKEIPSTTLGEMVMVELHGLDQVAYVRFASVYREFTDLKEFVADLTVEPSTATAQSSLSFPFVAETEPTESSSSKSSTGKSVARSTGKSAGRSAAKPSTRSTARSAAKPTTRSTVNATVNRTVHSAVDSTPHQENPTK